MTEPQQSTTEGTSPGDDELVAHRRSVAAIAETTHTARQWAGRRRDGAARGFGRPRLATHGTGQSVNDETLLRTS